MSRKKLSSEQEEFIQQHIHDEDWTISRTAKKFGGKTYIRCIERYRSKILNDGTVPKSPPIKNAPIKKSKKGLQPGYDRKTYILEDAIIEKIDAFAMLDRFQQNEYVNKILSKYFKTREGELEEALSLFRKPKNDIP